MVINHLIIFVLSCSLQCPQSCLTDSNEVIWPWLNVKLDSLSFKLCVTVYKSLHNEAPGYLQELCMPQRSARLPARALYARTKRRATCKSSVCHNEAPGYLQELCMPVNMNTRRSTLWFKSDRQLIVSRTKTKAGESAFSVAGPRAWNSLPVTVRQLLSLSPFNDI